MVTTKPTRLFPRFTSDARRSLDTPWGTDSRSQQRGDGLEHLVRGTALDQPRVYRGLNRLAASREQDGLRFWVLLPKGRQQRESVFSVQVAIEDYVRGLARKFGSQISIVEPYAGELPVEFKDSGAELVDLDHALENCGILIVLVDHDVFKVVPSEERAGALVYDTRGIWPDASIEPGDKPGLRLAS